MHAALVIPVGPRVDAALLAWTIQGYSRQILRAHNSLEVLIGIDGDAEGSSIPDLAGFPFGVSIKRFPRMAAAAVRNALVKDVSLQTDLLIFGNADTRPAPDMVQRHIDTIAAVPPGSMVLGSAPWDFPRGPQTVFDVLLAQTTVGVSRGPQVQPQGVLLEAHPPHLSRPTPFVRPPPLWPCPGANAAFFMHLSVLKSPPFL